MSILLYKNGQQIGPLDEAGVLDLISKGEISPSDLLWREGMPEWRPVAEIFPVSVALPLPVPPPLPKGSKVSVSQDDPFKGSMFILAKVNEGGSENHYDVINVESAKVIICIRESEISTGGKFLRSGFLDAWGGGQTLSKFHVEVSDPEGAVYMVVKGGGMWGHSEVFRLTGEKTGDIKRISKFNLNFEAYAEEGVLFRVISKGLGKMTSEQEIFDKDENRIGKVIDSDWGDAKKLIGDKIRLIDSDSLLRSKYSYNHRIEIERDLSIKEKCFLFAAIYQLAHVAGE